MGASVFATPTPAMPEDTPPPTAFPPDSASHSAPPRRRWLGALVALLIVGALGGSAWYFVERSKKPPETAQGPGGPGGPGGGPGGGGPGRAGPGGAGANTAVVGAALAVKGELPRFIEALGTVTPVYTVQLRPQVTGVLIEVPFTEGQMVSKGQLLARIDPLPYEQALAQAQGTRARNEAQLAAARVTLARYETLWKQDSIARQDVDTQAALVKQLEGTVQSDSANERAAQINLGYTRMLAPIAGRIGLRAVDPGNMITAGNATAIATITQITPIDVSFAVPQDRVPEVLDAQRQGAMPVDALDRARAQVLAVGRFSTLDNQIDAATGTVRAKARFANAEAQLFPNQFVNVRMKLGAVPGVLVPVTAVRTGPQGDYVYVIDAERVAHMRSIKRGGATAEQVLVTSGLEGGERVVTEGGDRVKDGGKVVLPGGRRPGAPADGANPTRPAGAPGGASAAGAAATAGAAASAPASGGNTDWAGLGGERPPYWDRLTPEVQKKVLSLPPDERRPFLQKLREERQAREAAPGGQAAPAPASPPAPGAAASGGNTDWAGLGGERPPYWDRLTPEVQKKVLSLPPDERRPFLQKLREERERRQREAQSQ